MALNTSKCNHLMSLPFKGLTTFSQCWWLKTVMEENTWHICLHVGRVFRCRARICRCLGVVWACGRSDDRTAASVRTGCRRRLPVCDAPRTHHPAQANIAIIANIIGWIYIFTVVTELGTELVGFGYSYFCQSLASTEYRGKLFPCLRNSSTWNIAKWMFAYHVFLARFNYWLENSLTLGRLWDNKMHFIQATVTTMWCQ